MSVADREKWESRWRRQTSVGPPSAFVLSLAPLLPRSGRALDLAGGSGRHALWLAERGLAVTLVDISEAALGLARAAAAVRHLTLTTAAVDLDVDPLPPGPWDAIVVTQFLWPHLFERAPEVLAPGGLLAFAQPTRRNLHRHTHPTAQYLIDEGVLPSLVQGLEIIRYEEDWLDEGRHEARIVARRPAVCAGGTTPHNG
jgi:SAM-dependent methyltransferase